MAIYRGAGGSGNSTSDAYLNAVTVQAVIATDAAAEAAASASEIKDVTATATNLTVGASATASYTSGTGVLAFGIPTGATGTIGPIGLTGAAGADASVLTSADAASTAADVVLTNADVVSTNADVVLAEADKVQTGLDRVATNADVVLAEADKVQTGLDRTATATSEANALTYKNNAAASASTATTQATNSANSATASANSAASIGSAETSSANSATAAASSASTASTQAGIATTKASQASTSASNSAADVVTTHADVVLTHADVVLAEADKVQTGLDRVAVAADLVLTNQDTIDTAADVVLAEAAKVAAEAAYDSFDDRYLGAKTVDPTLDNDGAALITGALYFNSTASDMKVYNGTAWVAAYASLSGALIATNNLSDVPSASSARTNLGVPALAHNHVAANITDFDTEVSNNSSVAANTTKVTNVTTDLTKTATTTDVTINSSDGTNVAVGPATTLVAGVMTKAVFDEHVLNNAKVSDVNHNVSTNLSTTHNASTVVVNSSDGTNATINAATSTTAGIMSEAIYDAHVLNNAKVSDIDHNVTTNLTTTAAPTTVTINSSDGTNAAIAAADITNAGVMTKAMYDEHVLNNAKVTNVAHPIVPVGAVFTDTNTTYSVGDGGLTQVNFTTADNTKLDAIELGATADQTASQLLVAIKTVDGASSGLDADLLDGNHASAFLTPTGDGSQLSGLPATGATTAQASAITANTAKTGITTAQASAISANTAKTGITTAQASAISANTAKVTNSTDASDLSSGTLTDAIFPATLPAISGANLTNLPSGATSINGLTDVDTSTVAPTDGQVLAWDNAASKWEPTTSASSESYTYTATSGQTAFTGADTNSATLSYTVGKIHVFLNGILLDAADYTATDGTTITLAVGATTGDTLQVVAYGVLVGSGGGGGGTWKVIQRQTVTTAGVYAIEFTGLSTTYDTYVAMVDLNTGSNSTYEAFNYQVGDATSYLTGSTEYKGTRAYVSSDAGNTGFGGATFAYGKVCYVSGNRQVATIECTGFGTSSEFLGYSTGNSTRHGNNQCFSDRASTFAINSGSKTLDRIKFFQDYNGGLALGIGSKVTLYGIKTS